MSLSVFPMLKAVDFMAEAKEVMKMASSLSEVNHLSSDDLFSQELLCLIEKELTVVMNYTKNLPLDCILNSALRTRTEYVLFLIHNCQRKSDQLIVQSLVDICMSPLFDLLKILEQRIDSSTDDDLSLPSSGESDLPMQTHRTQPSHSTNSGHSEQAAAEEEKAEIEREEWRKHVAERELLGASRTQWIDMCFTSAAMAIVALLRQIPGSRELLDLSLADCIALGCSAHWQLQCVGLRLVHGLLSGERDHDTSNVKHSDSGGHGSGGGNESSGGRATNTDSTVSGIGMSGRAKSSKLSKSQSAVGIEARTGVSSKNGIATNNSSVSGGSKSVKERGSNSSGGTNSSSGNTRVSTSAGSGVSNAVDGSLNTRSTSPSTTNTTTSNNNTTTTSTTRTSRSSTAVAGTVPLRRSASSAQQGSFRTQTQVLRAPRCVDEVCKSGYLRTLVALLLHSKEIVRKAAAETVQLILDISIPASITTHITTATDICACCVEQGLVAQLEYIQQGVYVYRNPSHNTTNTGAINTTHNNSTTLYFPEVHIRTVALTLLQHVAYTVHTQPALLARLTGALLHSGHSTLRVNLVSGLLYATGRCAEIGRLLCAPIAVPVTTTASSTNNAMSNNTTSSGGLGSRSVKGIAVTPPITNSSSKTNNNNTNNSTSSKSNNNNTATASNNSITLTHTTPRYTLFHTLLTNLVRDAQDFRNLLHILTHFMQCALNMQSIVGVGSKSDSSSGTSGGIGNEISTQTDFTTLSTTSSATTTHPLLQHMECMVLVEDALTSRTTRMICPALHTIRRHSAQLADTLQVAMERQIQSAIQIIQSAPTINSASNSGGGGMSTHLSPSELEARLLTVLKGLEDSSFAVLRGSYNVWQEIFSHMSDAYLLGSVHALSTVGLVEALYLAARHGMRDLGNRYAEALVLRLDNSNFLQIFQASVGIYFPAKVAATARSLSSTNVNSTASNGGSSGGEIDSTPLTLHLYQALHCIKYLDANLERIVTLWKPKDSTVVVDCVHRIMLCLFLTE